MRSSVSFRNGVFRPARLARLAGLLTLIVCAGYWAAGPGSLWAPHSAWAWFAADSAPAPLGEAVGRMTVPEGFQVQLFAGEPDIVQPIAMTTDDRGRLWVVECMAYPNWIAPAMNGKPAAGPGTDRVVILTDTDGDGRHDQRQVFAEKLYNLSAIQYGHGGVWLCSTPNLIFIPDRDGNDQPDGPPEVLLDGFSLQAKHNVSAAMQWGPDGWLYGCNGILSNSRIGKPGTPDAERIAINCGVWRYHPLRHKFEVVASGTTNPWGLDFDDYGQIFITNCVIAHLWHVVPGGHYQRMFGQDLNPQTYELIATCADHIHWGGGAWQESRTNSGAHDHAGGGHAHSGAAIYLGNNFPAEFRNSLFTCNIHGNRVNRDPLERHGSGYVGHHAPDFLHAHDSWFRGVCLTTGADGSLFVADWSDTEECHDYEDIHRENGRIYRVTYGPLKAETLDLKKLSDTQLVELQKHPNDWFGRHARRLLMERAAKAPLDQKLVLDVSQRLLKESDERLQLRWLWTWNAISGRLPVDLILPLLKSPNEAVRAWTVRLVADEQGQSPAPQVRERLIELAQADNSPLVQLHLASAVQGFVGLPITQPSETVAVNANPKAAGTENDRAWLWSLATNLSARSSAAEDANLPLMIWYAIERLQAAEGGTGPILQLATRTQIPLLRKFIARRIGPTDAMIDLLGKLSTPNQQSELLQGLVMSVEGLRELKLPARWATVGEQLRLSPHRSVREPALVLAVLGGDTRAVKTLEETIRHRERDPQARQTAVATLSLLKRPENVPLLLEQLNDPAVRSEALRGLVAFDDANIAPAVLKSYPELAATEKLDALSLLASRPASALLLLKAIEANSVPKADVPLAVIRQILRLPGVGVREAVEKSWGQIRDTAAQRKQLASKYKADLTEERLQQAKREQGKALFQKNCASCHVLFGEGQKIGPELTGAQRKNVDYLLENLLDPSAVVATDYQVTVITTKDGRTLSGVIVRESPTALVLQTATGQSVVPISEVEERARQNLSLMPEGLLEKLSADEVRDLLSYLMSN